MKVLHVIDKSFIGGGQTVVANILRSFRGTDVACSLACRDGGPLLKTAEDMGVRTHRIPFDKRLPPGPSRRIASIVRSESIDVIHSHGLVATTYCVMALRWFGTRAPILYHQHGFHHHNYSAYSRWLRIRAEGFMCRRVAGVLAGSAADLELLTGGGYAPANRIHLVNYGIPEPSCSPERIGARTERDGIAPGRHGRRDRCAPPSTKIRRRLPARRCAGRETDPDRENSHHRDRTAEQELHALSRTLGLDNLVLWLGGRPNLPYLPQFWVGVLSSSWEGLPQTILEYMAGRIPIVTTDLAGCTGAIGPGGGLVVPIQNPAAMADAIVAALEDRALAAAMARSGARPVR